MEDVVDILMATYETESMYLIKQIDSILNQSYKNIRLIISDDNSKNESVRKILEEYRKKDNRVIIYFQEKNIGYIKNFEFLLMKSESDYICFSDHDDIWYEEKVKKSLEKLKQENVDLVYVNAKQIDEEDNILYESYFKYKNMPLVNGKSKLSISRCIGIGCSQMFTKSVKDNMLPYKSLVIAQDWLAAFIANEGKGISYIKEPLFGYRLHGTNVFGGRNLSQNLYRWKKENGTSYKSYLKYRNEKVIDKAYLDGIIMCVEYLEMKENEKYLNQLINYYTNIKKSKYINMHWIKYIKYLSGNNLGKKMIKEFIIFHIPIVGYIQYKKG